MESNLDQALDLFPWERELLAPLVASLVEDALAQPDEPDDDYSLDPFSHD